MLNRCGVLVVEDATSPSVEDHLFTIRQNGLCSRFLIVHVRFPGRTSTSGWHDVSVLEIDAPLLTEARILTIDHFDGHLGRCIGHIGEPDAGIMTQGQVAIHP